MGPPGLADRVLLYPRGHHEDRRAVRDHRGHVGEIGQGDRVSPVHVLDRKHPRLQAARPLGDLNDCLTLAPGSGRIVHGIVERAQLRRLGQANEIVEKYDRFGCDEAGCEGRVGGPPRCLSRAVRLKTQNAANERAARIPAGAGAEIEHQAEVIGEALPARHCQ